MSGNDHHAGPDGVANDPRQPCPDCGADPDFNDIHWQRCPSLTDTRPSLSGGRRLYEAQIDTDNANHIVAWKWWASVNAPALLELAEAACDNSMSEDAIARFDVARRAFRP